MAAANTDKLKKYKSLFATTLSTGIGTGTSDTLTPATVTGLPTDTAITLTLDRVDSGGVGTPATLERITGVISAGNLANYVRAKDNTTEQAHSGGAVVEMVWNAQDWNDMVDWGLVSHNQAGYLLANAVVASNITASNVTASKIAASGVIPGNLSASSVLAGNLAASSVLAGNLAASSILAGNHAASSVVAGNLAASSVVVGNIGASAIVLGNLAASSVSSENLNFSPSGVNYATSGPQANFSTSSTSYVDVTGATVSIAPSGTAKVHAVITGRIYSATAATAGMYVRLMIDGVEIQAYDVAMTTSNYAQTFSLSGQATVSSGTRVIKLMTKATANTINVDQANVNVIWS